MLSGDWSVNRLMVSGPGSSAGILLRSGTQLSDILHLNCQTESFDYGEPKKSWWKVLKTDRLTWAVSFISASEPSAAAGRTEPFYPLQSFLLYFKTLKHLKKALINSHKTLTHYTFISFTAQIELVRLHCLLWNQVYFLITQAGLTLNT